MYVKTTIRKLVVAYWCYLSQNCVNIGSDNGLSHFGTKLVPKLIQIYYRLKLYKQISGKMNKKPLVLIEANTFENVI